MMVRSAALVGGTAFRLTCPMSFELKEWHLDEDSKCSSTLMAARYVSF